MRRSRVPHFEQALRGAASQLDLLLPNQCAELLGAPHLFVSHQQLVETQPQRAACRAVEASPVGELLFETARRALTTQR